MPRLVFFVLLNLSFSLNAQQKVQHVSSTNNITGNSTFLSVEGLNKNSKAIIIVTLEKSNGKNPPIGVWFDGARWAIFNQDMAPMAAGLTFTIDWKDPDQNNYYEKTSTKNIDNGKVIIDNPSLNNNPLANFSITQVWNPEGVGGVYNNTDVAIEYDKALGKWTIRNKNNATIPAGSSFNISINANKSVSVPDVKQTVKLNSNNATTNVIPNNNAVQNQVSTTVNPNILNSLPAELNLDFENGLTRWTGVGSAFANQPIRGNTVMSDRVLTNMVYDNGGLGGDYWKGIPYPIGIKNNSWVGTFENGNGETATGTLSSSPMRISQRSLHFLMGGKKDINRLYVELQVKLEDYQASWGASKKGFFGITPDGFTKVNRLTPLLNSDELYRYSFDFDRELNGQYLNKTIRIVVVDSSDRGHINVDDFEFADNLNDLMRLNKGGFNLMVDADKPVFGFFDSHAHPAADEAFGKKYLVGSCNTPLSTTWSNELCTEAHTAGATLDGFTNIFDPHKFFDGGWPNMYGYPKFNSKMHQKYQVDLIKRAWQGGLKIFCALGINNMYIATRVLGHHDNLEAIDDESVLVREINVIKGMVNANSDWMAIATTPQQARRSILEGKLCVILGVEADVFGNFKSSDCRWDENARRQDATLTLINGANANEQLETKLNQYWEMGLRQILPIHYLSKPFGGAAVFNGNTFLPQISFYGNVRVKTGIPDRIGFSLYEDFPTGPAFVGNFLSYADYAGRVLKQDAGSETSMVNADGLTNEGRILFRKLMKKGFIVDQEHASYQSKRDIFRIAFDNGNYPVIASHCGPEGLSFIWTGAPVRFNGNDQDKVRNFGTSTIRYVSHEMELNDESIQGIKNTNGTIGVFMVSNHKRQYVGRWGSVPNDCPSSTKTMAQMFLYTLDKMDGHGVGLASDLPMVDALCPRFGPYAAWGLMEEKDDALKKNLRTTNRMAQTKGVKYDVASRTYYNELFQRGEIDGFEEDVWKALAAWDAGVNAVVDESKVALSGEPGHGGRIRNMVKGLNANSQDQLLRPCITCGDAPWEQAAMFCLNKGVDPMSLSVYDAAGQRDVSSMLNKILPVWNLWKEKNGGLHPNDPLRRCITGNRYWDFNLDGFAHYGLLPDLLQDLKNIGFTQLQLKPLFSSAEDYIRMWEIAEKKKFDVREP